ncbi:fused MFS/spermidine synthase, partial [Candidatus Pacearchaeota archaeon]|nr:fused MFS/spermidine synthase [Candidatus Pacearchaeota archaeon]
WTSIIGVVLTGITVGNYLGGRIADRFPARKTIAVLLGLASVACVTIIVLNNLVGGWVWLWQLSWPVRVFSHVSLVFLVPSILLGTASPVVAKMALDRGLPKGRTVGDIYAFGTAGSIAGTFLAGFYLIATMGTIAIIWTISGALLMIAILYWCRFWAFYVWAAILVAIMTMGMAPAEWAQDNGATLKLRKEPNPAVIYEDETQYCYVAVRQTSQNPDIREFIQDKLRHSEIALRDIKDLKYSYEQIHAAITHRYTNDNDKLSVLVIGGGGYVFPRYVEEVWPGSTVDVVEIDPGVTKAAMEAFGLDKDTAINTFTMDARNYVDQLIYNERNAETKIRYDFIYEDALNDYSIPFQLVTKEFNDKIATLLGDEGIYLIEMIDIFNEGKFLSAYVNTLQETFPHVSVVTNSGLGKSERNTFVIAASKRQFDLSGLENDYKERDLELWALDEADMAELATKSKGLVMTDDYVPVENMLAPVVRKSAADFLSGKYMKEAKDHAAKGEFDESLQKYAIVAKIDPMQGTLAYNSMAIILGNQGKTKEAIDTFYKAIEAEEKAEVKGEIEAIHLSLGSLLKKAGKYDEAKKQLNLAVEGFRAASKREKYINSYKVHSRLGDSLAELGDLKEASESFARA